jgi:transcriptional regulator NrdR family protein
MMPSQAIMDGPRGLFCPKCKHQLDRQAYVAKTYSSPAGVYRRRVCAKCFTDVETSETVVGVEADFLDMTDCTAQERKLLVDIVRGMRQCRKAGA